VKVMRDSSLKWLSLRALFNLLLLCSLSTPSDEPPARLMVGSSPKYDEGNLGYAHKV